MTADRAAPPRPRHPIVVMTAIYPGAERFLEGYLRSLAAQRGPFDLVVLRDGEVAPPASPFPGGTLTFSGLTIAEIRHRGLAELRRLGYRAAVLTDVDDVFVTPKVDLLAAAVEGGADFAFADLDLVDAAGAVYERGVLRTAGLDRPPAGPEDLLHRNYLGLGNGAIRLSWMERIGRPPPSCGAYDWWLFTSLLAAGARGGYVAGAETRYLQGATLFQPSPHGPPAVREALTRARLCASLEVKLAHYRWLAAEANGWSVPDGYRAEVARALRGMEELARRLADEAFVADYLARVNAGWRSLPRGWWGAAVDPATAAALPAAR